MTLSRVCASTHHFLSMHSLNNKWQCSVLTLNVPVERFAEVHNTMIEDFATVKDVPDVSGV